MANFRDNTGANVTLGKLLGRGGEGSVFEVQGNSKLVGKVYHEVPKPETADKLGLMVRKCSPQIERIAAWPARTLHNPNNKQLVGILMPRIEGWEVHELYSPAQRKIHFGTADWKFLIRVARNCAAAVATLHEQGIVVGDVNQGNVFVTRDATVRLIDCDSYQITDGQNRIFRCRVGVPHFTPPELQGIPFDQVNRTTEHDSFGLAILVFHLLFMGRHPFAGTFLGQGDLPIEKAIEEYRFAYSRFASQYKMKAPPNTLQLTEVSSDIGELFERSFGKSGRPPAAHWAMCLEQFEKSLVECEDVPGHLKWNKSARCPWCEIENRGGPNFFVSLTATFLPNSGARFDLAGTWQEIEKVDSPHGSFTFDLRVVFQRRYPSSLKSAVPSGAVREEDPVQRLIYRVAVVSGVLSVFTIPGWFIGLAGTVMAFVFSIWSLWIDMTSAAAKEVAAKLKALESTDFKRTERTYADTVQRAAQRFTEKRRALWEAKQALDGLEVERQRHHSALKDRAQERQKEAYLESQLIRHADIPGIGPARTATLEVFGIESALDITQSRIENLSGFGPYYCGLLLSWRNRVEANFRFDPRSGVPAADTQAVDVKFFQLRTKHERILRNGAKELKQIVAAAQAEVNKLTAIGDSQWKDFRTASTEYEDALQRQFPHPADRRRKGICATVLALSVLMGFIAIRREATSVPPTPAVSAPTTQAVTAVEQVLPATTVPEPAKLPDALVQEITAPLVLVTEALHEVPAIPGGVGRFSVGADPAPAKTEEKVKLASGISSGSSTSRFRANPQSTDPEAPVKMTAIYGIVRNRLGPPLHSEHLYTTDSKEIDTLLRNGNCEYLGLFGYGADSAGDGRVKIERFLRLNRHRYYLAGTRKGGANGREEVMPVWVWTAPQPGMVPVYASSNPDGTDTIFSLSLGDHEQAIRDELRLREVRKIDHGVMFYVIPPEN